MYEILVFPTIICAPLEVEGVQNSESKLKKKQVKQPGVHTNEQALSFPYNVQSKRHEKNER